MCICYCLRERTVRGTRGSVSLPAVNLLQSISLDLVVFPFYFIFAILCAGEGGDNRTGPSPDHIRQKGATRLLRWPEPSRHILVFSVRPFPLPAGIHTMSWTEPSAHQDPSYTPGKNEKKKNCAINVKDANTWFFLLRWTHVTCLCILCVCVWACVCVLASNEND